MTVDKQRVVAVGAELAAVAGRLTERVFEPVGNQPPLPIPNLRFLAAHHFPDEWQRDRVVALEALLRRGSSHLNGLFAESLMTVQEAALRLFNLDGGADFPTVKKRDLGYLGHDSDKKYSELRNDLKKRVDPRGESTFGRDLRKLRLSLARVLLDPDFPFEGDTAGTETFISDGNVADVSIPALPGAHNVARFQNFDARYAARPEIHAQFRIIMEAGIKCVLLTGPAGMGKTRLATEVPKEYASSDEILHLRADTVDSLSLDVLAAMHKYGLTSRISSTISVNHCMAELLASPQGPMFTIIDNVESPSQLLNIVPSSLHSTVIATCRTSTRLPEGWSVINVGRMTEDESCDMIARALPDLRQHEVRDLAVHLHGYALVTKYSCLLLEHGHLSVLDFIREFGRSRSGFLAKVPSGREELLGDVLKRVREQVRHRSIDADFLLSCLGTIKDICGTAADVPHNYLSACLQIAHGVRPNRDGTTFEYAIALRTLQDFGFLERENLGCFQTHPLISELMVTLAEDSFAKTCPILMRAHASSLPEGTLSSRGMWFKKKSYSDALASVIGHSATKELAYLYLDQTLTRFGLNQKNLTWLKKRKRPKIDWGDGRMAWNLIEGPGKPLRLILWEDEVIGGRRKTWEEFRKDFRVE
ncbi:ATP-binding protein [Streptomyces sp. NL15-2K]|uniref:ATP-binding protein n=1 Tax=Streptomyces sp. NL15-2K TaxID=376149 RepID=UPI000F581BD6|nr:MULTISPECIES: ATP-binding protein [Actinomycetes]WKX09976.1 ATP-binding protein [Kutzneria buriramensis]